DAAWGNLRYLLMRPVPRGRLLVAKAIVAGMLIWAATILVALAGLVAGVVLFGAKSVTVPNFANLAGGSLVSVFQLSQGELLLRVALANGYVAFGFTAASPLGALFPLLTSTA